MKTLHRIITLALACLVSLPALATGSIPPIVADRIIYNADIFTANPATPHAQALAMKNGNILWAGTNESVLAFAGQYTLKEDLSGRQVVPGFVDAHEHMLTPFDPATDLCPIYRRAPKGTPKVLDTDPSFDDVRIAAASCAASRPLGTWVVFLFGQNFYRTSKSHNVRVELSIAAPRHAVTGFDAAEGHGMFANDTAFTTAGISTYDPNPYSGYYGRNADGSLDGFVYELAQVRIFNALAMQHPDSYFAAQYVNWLNVAASVGIVSALDIPFEYGPQRAAAVKALVNHKVNLTVACLPLSAGYACPEGLRATSGKMWVKTFIDGAVKACGGFMERGYLDSAGQCPSVSTPNYTGRSDVSFEQLQAAFQRVKADPNTCGLFHAFGSQAVKMAYFTGMIEKMSGQCVTMEHWDFADVVAADAARALGWYVVQNPGHLALKPDIDTHYQPVDAKAASPLATLLAHGVRLALGRDGFGPITPDVDGPLQQIAQAMDHRNPAERITAEQGVIAYTRDSAKARREVGGMLVSGYPASWVEVDRKVIGSDVATVKAARVKRTVIKGVDAFEEWP